MQRVRDDLRQSGFNVWTDEGIEPGIPLWKDAIEEAIEAAACMIVMLSPVAKKSHWVKREVDYAITQEIHVCPLLAAGTEQTSVPIALISAQYIDIRNSYEQGFSQLKATISRYVSVEDEAREILAVEKLRIVKLAIEKSSVDKKYGERMEVERLSLVRF